MTNNNSCPRVSLTIQAIKDALFDLIQQENGPSRRIIIIKETISATRTVNLKEINFKCPQKPVPLLIPRIILDSILSIYYCGPKQGTIENGRCEEDACRKAELLRIMCHPLFIGFIENVNTPISYRFFF